MDGSIHLVQLGSELSPRKNFTVSCSELAIIERCASSETSQFHGDLLARGDDIPETWHRHCVFPGWTRDEIDVDDEWRTGMSLIVIVLLVLLLVGALPAWPYSSGWGYYPSGGLGLVLLIVLILILTGRI